MRVNFPTADQLDTLRQNHLSDKNIRVFLLSKPKLILPAYPTSTLTEVPSDLIHPADDRSDDAAG